MLLLTRLSTPPLTGGVLLLTRSSTLPPFTGGYYYHSPARVPPRPLWGVHRGRINGEIRGGTLYICLDLRGSGAIWAQGGARGEGGDSAGHMGEGAAPRRPHGAHFPPSSHIPPHPPISPYHPMFTPIILMISYDVLLFYFNAFYTY